MSVADITLVTSYAQALHEAAVKAGVADQLANQAEALQKLVTEEEKLRAFMEAPNIPRETKEQVFVKVFGGKFHTLLINFVRLLIRRGRLEILFASLEGYVRVYRKAKGVETATITTAIALAAKDQAALQAALTRAMGKQLVIDWKVDPEVLGGVRFLCGDTLIDTTVLTGLDRLRRDLSSARVI